MVDDTVVTGSSPVRPTRSGPAQRAGDIHQQGRRRGVVALERRLIEWDEWSHRRSSSTTTPKSLRTYATTWLPERTAVRGLKPKPVSEYQSYLDRLIFSALGDLRLKDVTSATIRGWVGGRTGRHRD